MRFILVIYCKLVLYTCLILICTEFTNNGDGIDLRCYKNRDQLYTNNRVLTYNLTKS